MSDDVSHRRSTSEASAETPHKPASLASLPDIARRDSRNTLPYPPYAHSAAGQRMMQFPPLMAGAYAAAGQQGTMSSAASVRSAVLSNYSQQPYGLNARNVSLPYAGSVMSSRGFSEIPTATSDNDYLGFCKGAWKVQNGDRKGAMEKCKEAQSWSRNAGKTTTLAAHLKCQQQKCTFRSNYISPDASLIWDKVTTYADKGVKIRWRFLAKSHVPQRVVIKNQFAFKCLICVYMGKGVSAGVYVGTGIYLEHINSEHRGQHFHDVMLYKIGCINDRVAEDDEDFDINIWPLSVHHAPPPTEHYLSDALLADPTLRVHQASSVTGMTSNQPWVVDVNEYDFEPQHVNHGVPQNNSHPSPTMLQRTDTRTPSAPTASPPDAGSSPTSPWQPQNTLVPPTDELQRRPSANTEDSQSTPLTTSLTNVLQVFGEGSIIIDQLKAHSPAVRVPFLDILEQSLQDSPQEIQKEWQRGIQRFGPIYESGDYIAIIALSQLTFQLHNNVVDKLRRAVYGGESTDPAYLADAADLCRQQTIAALHEFKQRLMQTPPQQQIVQPSVPPTAAAAMQQAQQTQREASMPRQHISHMRPDLWKDPYMPGAATRNSSAASSRSNKSRELPEPSDAGTGRRRSSVLGTIKEKASRKVSISRGSQPQQPPRPDSLPSQSDVDELGESIRNDLHIHPALRNRPFEPKNPTLAEVAELDATAMRGALA